MAQGPKYARFTGEIIVEIIDEVAIVSSDAAEARDEDGNFVDIVRQPVDKAIADHLAQRVYGSVVDLPAEVEAALGIRTGLSGMRVHQAQFVRHPDDL